MGNAYTEKSFLQRANYAKICGIPLFIYFAITVLVVVCMVMEWLPKGIIGAFAIMMVFGFLLSTIGDNLPIVNTFLGGGAIVCIFGAAAMVSTGFIPTSVVENVDAFMNTTGFLNFYIAALITGSILGMDRKLLLNASLRFLPVALCAMTFAIVMVGFVGWAVGFGFNDAIMYVAIPMMGGGMGAGVVPMSGIYAAELGVEASEIISRMVPASTLGNCMAIIGAGLLAKLGEVKPGISGNGKLMRKQDSSLNQKADEKPELQTLGMGLIISISFFLLGTVVNKFLPVIHTYAWMIILVAVAKAVGIIPASFENAAQQWSKFVMKNWTSALLVGIGISLIDLKAVAAAISPIYLLLVVVVVGGVALGAGVGGQLVGFYPIESSVTAGLCTTNMGGTGDVAVLSACKRMELLPFAQISTRICGALVLILSSVLVKILL